MTLDELMELASEARENLGGDAEVRIASQPGWPLRAALACVTIPARGRAGRCCMAAKKASSMVSFATSSASGSSIPGTSSSGKGWSHGTSSNEGERVAVGPTSTTWTLRLLVLMASRHTFVAIR